MEKSEGKRLIRKQAKAENNIIINLLLEHRSGTPLKKINPEKIKLLKMKALLFKDSYIGKL